MIRLSNSKTDRFLEINIDVFEEYSLKAFERYVAVSQKVVVLETRI